MIKNILFILIGVISIGLSVSCFKADTGDYVSKEFYGGDAFTGIQHASAETGMNVRVLAQITSKGFGSVLLIAGLALVVVGIPCKKIENAFKTPEQSADSKQTATPIENKDTLTSQEEKEES